MAGLGDGLGEIVDLFVERGAGFLVLDQLGLVVGGDFCDLVLLQLGDSLYILGGVDLGGEGLEDHLLEFLLGDINRGWTVPGAIGAEIIAVFIDLAFFLLLAVFTVDQVATGGAAHNARE